ncbi:hypothetical protein ACH9EU_10065 [Kocuria sp. M1R5S2]|uniref:hypothetical protein n=1 Tax=Kocuria rhizosphaerae TaxID=3376285 RepID=UPI003798F68D
MRPADVPPRPEQRPGGSRAVVLGLLAAMAQTWLFALTFVAGLGGGRWNWALAVLLVVAGLAVVFGMTVHGRRLVALVPVVSAAVVVALLVLGPSPFGTA